MKKVKKTFKRIGSVFAVLLLILVMTILPTMAAMTIYVHVTYISSSHCTGFQFKTSESANFTTYQEGSDIVATSEYNATAKLALTAAGVQAGYTGFLIYLTQYSNWTTAENLANLFLNDVLVLNNGQVYVDSNEEFYFTRDTQDFYFACVPVNYANYISSIGNHAYEDGKRDGLAENQARINELESTIAVLTDESTSAGQYYSQGLAEGFDQGSHTDEYIRDVTTTIVNGTGSIIGELLGLEVLGIKMYQIALVAVMLPLTIFLVKIALRHG